MASAEYIASLKARLAAYKACELAILNGAQKYTIEDRMIQRADLPAVQRLIKDLESELASLDNTDLPVGYRRATMRSQRALFRRY